MKKVLAKLDEEKDEEKDDAEEAADTEAKDKQKEEEKKVVDNKKEADDAKAESSAWYSDAENWTMEMPEHIFKMKL